MGWFNWFGSKNKTIEALETTVEQLTIKNAQLIRDVETLEKDNDRLKKKCGESRSGPAIIKSKSSSKPDRLNGAADIGSHTVSGSKSSKNSGVDFFDYATDAAGDVVEGVGEVIGDVVSAALD
jgi:hypothetical protein